jgi:hypothetical protein
MRDCRLGELVERRGLAAHPPDLAEQFLAHPLVGSGGEFGDRADEQVHQIVGDLAAAEHAQRAQQGGTHRIGMPAQFVGRFGCGALPVGVDQLRGHAGEEVVGQRHLADTPKPSDLGQHALQTGAAGIGFEVAQMIRESPGPAGCAPDGARLFARSSRIGRNILVVAPTAGRHGPVLSAGYRPCVAGTGPRTEGT